VRATAVFFCPDANSAAPKFGFNEFFLSAAAATNIIQRAPEKFGIARERFNYEIMSKQWK